MSTNHTYYTLRGELALVLAVIINSLGVVLMLHSGSGISAISSVPYAFSEVFPTLTLGTWTYIFQGLLIAILMIMRKRFVISYLFSFVVGFFFGIMIDIHEMWITLLPTTLPLRILYFVISYFVISFGITISNRCQMPIIPTAIRYSRVKISFDVLCLLITACMTFAFLGHIRGLGIGTIFAAFTMGKCIGIIGEKLDKKLCFVSFLSKHQTA